VRMAVQAESKAYSYRRFSTPEQAKGDSLRRQTEAAQAWADRRGVALDAELNLTDLGISAYTGANRDVGALGAFLNAVREGTVPANSWLLVESLDRISREPAIDASFTMQDIIRAGVTVVDLSDNAREYNLETLRGDNGMSLMMMVMMFSRANNESATKGIRVAAAFANKRRRFASDERLNKPYTRRLPAWITWDESTASYVPIKERAELLRWMFEMAADGLGQHSIAAHLNETKVDTWGAGKWKAAYWHKSYIRKLLTNKAAIGIFVPHRVVNVDGKRTKQRIPEEPIAHRFPAAVDRELFERVNASLSTTGARGRNANGPARSIFAGIMKCQHCGGTVTRVNKGEWVYLVCSAAHGKSGTCHYESVPYLQAVTAFQRSLRRMMDSAPRGNDTGGIEGRIEQLQVWLDAGEDRVNELLEISISDKSRAAKQALQKAEHELDAVRDDLRRAIERRDTLTSTNVMKRLAAVEKALTRKPMDTDEANKALRSAVHRMVMKPKEGVLEIYWHHAEEPQTVVFVTSRKDWTSPFETEDHEEA
jgi:DNA invertase Pin-like site-specific DNA recombinase